MTPGWRRSQRLLEALVLAALALIGVSAYLTWTRADPGGGRSIVEFDGYDISRAPVTTAIAAVVAAIVLRLAGTAIRRVLSVVLAALGAATVAVALTVRPGAGELAVKQPRLSQVVTDHVEVSIGPAPWFALAGGIALIAAGAIGIMTAHRWRRPTARYEREPTVTTPDPWKAIDSGQDPTI